MGKKEWLENLAKNMKKERKILKMSQQKLAEISKLSMTTITQIEQGNIPNPTLDTIESIGRALNKSNPLFLLLKK
ncbi:MAG: helix-turn-helix transcriptional regulator [Halobacteriovoraceae bacterium]|nr:helix-turn-helix transcriptional regulator [Halobacteriovoraceae bacterium]